MSFFNKDQVMQYLPHRDPFLFIDSIENVTLPAGVDASLLELHDFKSLVGGEVESSFLVREDLSCFKGHFPGKPIFPGVLQVELMGQTCAFLMTANRNFEVANTDMDIVFMGIDKVRFRKMVLPTMILNCKAKLNKVRGNICQFSCHLYHEEDLVSQAEVLASLKFKG